MKTLLALGASPNLQCKLKFHALHWCCDGNSRDHHDCARALLNSSRRHAIMHARQTNAQIPTAAAAAVAVASASASASGKAAGETIGVNVVDQEGLTPLYWAAKSSDVKLAKILISFGASYSEHDRIFCDRDFSLGVEARPIPIASSSKIVESPGGAGGAEGEGTHEGVDNPIATHDAEAEAALARLGRLVYISECMDCLPGSGSSASGLPPNSTDSGCCDCKGDCLDSENCACINRNGQMSPYDRDGSLELKDKGLGRTKIIECSSECRFVSSHHSQASHGRTTVSTGPNRPFATLSITAARSRAACASPKAV